MLTRRGRLTLGFFVALLVVGRVLGITELFGFAAVAALLVVVALVQARPASVRVTLSGRVTPEGVAAGEQAVLELLAENVGAAPTPGARLQLVPSGGGHHRVLVPRLAPGERATVTVGLDTRTRGRKSVRGYEALIADSFGLASRRLTASGSFAYLVQPRTEELPQTLPIGAGGLGLESTRSAAERLRSGASLLRNYVEGDDFRLIHWRTTARIGDLMVREGGEPDLSGRSGTTVALVTHCEPGRRFERAVEVAASVLRAAAAEGPFRLVTTGGHDSGMVPGLRHLESTLVTLAAVEPSSLRPSERGHADASSRGRGGRATAGPSVNGTAGPALHMIDTLLGGRFSGPDDWNVLIVVEVLGSPGDLAERREELDRLPPRSGMVALMLVGGSELSFERLSHEHVVMRVPEDRSLAEIWNTPVDVPVGETRVVQA